MTEPLRVRIRIVGARHQQKVAMHNRVVDGLSTDHADDGSTRFDPEKYVAQRLTA